MAKGLWIQQAPYKVPEVAHDNQHAVRQIGGDEGPQRRGLVVGVVRAGGGRGYFGAGVGGRQRL